MSAVAPPARRLRFNLAWAAALMLLGVGVILGARGEAEHRRQAAREAAVQADIVAASVTAALAFDDRKAIREYVDALRVNAAVASAAVYDLSGRAIVTYERAGSIRPPDHLVPAARRAGATVIRPVTQQGVALGSVYLAMRPESLSQVLARHSALALLLVMAFLMQGVISRSAWQLRRRAEELSEANRRLTFEIQERAKAEEALRQSQKMEALGQITGGIAHDFNNLLQVVQGAFDLIRKKPADSVKVATWAENGLQAAERGASLTRQLLTFSRAQKLDLRPFRLEAMVEEMRDLITRTVGPAFQVEFRLEAGEGGVVADRTQVELAVLNLAINARDAMGDAGDLVIATRAVQIDPGHPVLDPGDYLELSVTDSGPGMPAEIAERAFEPFFTTKGVGKGTGLGLSQVYGVARQAGGVAFIEHPPEGGARVVVLLRRSHLEAAPKTGKPATPQAAVRPLSVLVVDDDLAVQRVAAETLEVLGHSVRLASSGPQALEMLEDERPDLVLLDFAMPGMNGAEVASQARRRWGDLPIVFASGYADTAAVEAAVGEAVILHKPFQIDQLARTIEAATAKT